MNILFVLYGDFTSNSINHIAPFTSELTRMGHSCAVAVPERVETVASVADCCFQPLLFQQVLAEPCCFPDGRAADLLHAWTPREIIRDFIFAYLAEHPETALLIHLEDGERDISATALGINSADLDLFDDHELAQRIPVAYAHPRYAECLLLIADGITVIQDKLAGLVPPLTPCVTVYPGVDLDLFRPQSPDMDLRAYLDIADDERIIVYQGGMNPIVLDEIHDLYLAIGLLNQRGYSCRLIRTGPGQPPFWHQLPAICRNHITDLGYVARERLPELLALADVCVQPGRCNMFNDLRLPSKIPEWLAMAKPVLLPAANIAALLEDGVNCLMLHQGTPQEIAERCIWVFDHPQQAWKIGQQGRRFAEQHFCLPQQAHLLAELYQQFITDSSSADSRRRTLHDIHVAAPPALFALRRLRDRMQKSIGSSSALESQVMDKATLQNLDKILSRWESIPLTKPDRYFNLRVYVDLGQGFTEYYSLSKSGLMNQTTRMNLRFPESRSDKNQEITLRLDPHDGIALIEIHSLRIRRLDTQDMLWNLDDASVNDLVFGKDVLHYSEKQPFTLISIGVDPWMTMPPLNVAPELLQVELDIKVIDCQKQVSEGLQWLAQDRCQASKHLAQTDKYISCVQSELTQQQQLLEKAEEQNKKYNQDLEKLETILMARSADIRLLVRLFETLQQDMRLVFDSLTWRIGYFFAEMFRRLTRKKRIPLVQDHIAQLMRTYQAWSQSNAVFKDLDLMSTAPIDSIKQDEFDESAYLIQYPDVRSAIERGEFKSGREHWELLGRQEILNGQRLYIKDFVNVRYPSPPREFTARDIERLNRSMAAWQHKPLISIVMPVYNVDVRWLTAAIESVRKQIYSNWQLCIADDCSTHKETLNYLHDLHDERIKVVFLEKNQGIASASNAALALAVGDFIALLDNDDELTPDALYEVVKAINEHDPDLIYSDEDKLTVEGQRVDPHFKPDYSPDLMLSTNYICHLGVYRRDFVEKIGGFRQGYEGAQDYDFVLRFLEKTQRVHHIPKVLYHWRMIPGSTAAQFSSKNHALRAGQKALEDALERRGIKGQILLTPYPGFYRVRRDIISRSLISIVIPFHDQPELLSDCLDSILEKTTYPDFEIIGVSNNSKKRETFELMNRYSRRDRRIRFLSYDFPFNYSAINNYAAQQVSGEHLLLLNNDITVISPDWLESLLEHSQRPEVGAVGAKLYYPDNTVQHAGVIMGVGGVAGHSHKHFDRNAAGYFARASLIQNLSAVTGACLMVKKRLYDELGGLDEKNLAIAFNDVDFCLRLRESGYLNIFTPYCELYHHESKSRGEEDTPEKKRRFTSEVNYMLRRHAKILESGDPYYNPNLTLHSDDFGLA